MGTQYGQLAIRLRDLRSLHFPGKGIKQISPILGIKFSYLSKIENGKQRPSIGVLNRIIKEYGLTLEEAQEVFYLAGYREGVVNVMDNSNDKGTGVSGVYSKKPDSQDSQGKINLDPMKTQVLFIDNVNIKADNYGFVIDFSQRMGTTNEFNVVARIGMNKEHIEALMVTLQGLLQKTVNEKSQAKDLKN